MPVCATWPFGKPAVEKAAERLGSGAGAVSALVAGLNVVENDPNTGAYFVGRGGLPNSAGSLSWSFLLERAKKLEACITFYLR